MLLLYTLGLLRFDVLQLAQRLKSSNMFALNGSLIFNSVALLHELGCEPRDTNKMTHSLVSLTTTFPGNKCSVDCLFPFISLVVCRILI